MSQLVKFVLCFLVSIVAYGLGRFGVSALFPDLSVFWLGAIGGVCAATAFFIALSACRSAARLQLNCHAVSLSSAAFCL